MGCIYMYTNKLNQKKYIGQTIRPLKQRHWEHLYRDNSYIDKALRKYGEENFTLEVLEDDIYDGAILNEREKFYIEKYDTFNNGYNLTLGGDGTSTFTADDVLRIIDLIKNTNKTFLEIGEMTGYSLYTISSINIGETCPLKDVNYPVRKNKITQKFFQKDLDNVIDLLINTDYTFIKIAEMTNTTHDFVYDTNRGKNSGDYHGVSIPIRKNKYPNVHMTKELALQIIDYLKQDLSAEQIATILDIYPYTVGQINRGKMAICKEIDEDFPIQKTPHRNKESAQMICATLSVDDVKEIARLLSKTKMPISEIAKCFSVTEISIKRINCKKTWKNLLTEYDSPIRKESKTDNKKRTV